MIFPFWIVALAVAVAMGCGCDGGLLWTLWLVVSFLYYLIKMVKNRSIDVECDIK